MIRSSKAVLRSGGVLAISTVLLLGSGCGDSGKEANEGNSPAPANRSAAVVPVAGGQPSAPAPAFTQTAPSFPTGGVTLEQLHQQGKTDVVP